MFLLVAVSLVGSRSCVRGFGSAPVFEEWLSGVGFPDSLWSLSASLSVLCRGVPSPVHAHLLVFGSSIVLISVLALFPTDRTFCFSASVKNLL